MWSELLILFTSEHIFTKCNTVNYDQSIPKKQSTGISPFGERPFVNIEFVPSISNLGKFLL